MEKEVVAALLGALGGLASGAAAAWVTMKSKRIDQVVEGLKLWVSAYETKMLEQRLTDYPKLWRLTEATSRRRIGALTSPSALGLAEQLTDWYYREGGMVMSEDARDKFFAARNSLEPLNPERDPNQWHAKVVDAFSGLRTALCEDMNSRRGPRLRSSEQRDIELEARIESKADY